MNKVAGKMVVNNGESEEELEVRVFPENVEPAKVSVGLNSTVNMGNYESLKLSVHVTLPCYAEEVEEAFDKARDFCEEKITQMLSDVERNRGGRR